MHITNLRKVGGSVMMVVPPALLEVLRLSAGAKVGLAVDNGRLVIEPQPRAQYTLADLLAQCDSAAAFGVEDQDWTQSAKVGDELI